MLKSDSKGFLISEAKIDAHELANGINGVRHDTSEILHWLKGRAKSSALQRARVSGPNSRASSSPGGGTRERDNHGRFIKAQPDVVTAVRQMTRQQAQQASAEKRAEAAGRARDDKGRFGAGDADGGGKDKKDGLFSRLKSALSDRAGTGDMDKVDPAIEAASELKNLVGGPMKALGSIGESVIGRGFSGDAKDKAVPFYKRMLQQLKLMRKDQSEFSKAETKAIKGIKAGGGGSGKSGGLLDGLLPDGALAALKGLGGFAVKASLPLASIFSAVKSFGTSTDEYASRLGTKDDGGIAKSIGIRTVGVMGDLGNTLTFGMAGKLGEALSPAVADIVDKSKAGIDAIKKTAAPVIAKAQAKGGSLLEKVIPGYRHKAIFDGINGGDSLTKNGSYTDAEADQVRNLKSSSANTSANLKGGMPKEIQEKIIQQANAAGLDPQMMLKMAAMESGGNTNAISSTGAIGIYQFTGKTASGVGIKNRFDADQNIAGGMALTKENMASLKASRLPVTAENLYLMLQLGPPAAKEVISGAASGKNIGDLSASTQKGISLNYGAGSKTAADYLDKNSTALTARADTVIGKSATGFLPTGTAASIPALAAAARQTPPTMPTLATAATVPAPLAAPAGIPSVSVSAPTAPAQAPRSDIPIPLSSKAPIEVIVRNDQLANRDLPDRRLASIATGGMAG